MKAEIQNETNQQEQPNNDEKQGRSCFGCLCDMRRAVIILSAIGIVLTIFSVVSNRLFLFDRTKDKIDDQDDIKRLDDLFIINLIVAGLSVVGYVLAIIGGIKFNERLVIINAVYMPIGFAVIQALLWSAGSDIEEMDYGFVNMLGPLIGTIMSVFVHVSFVKEIRCGIMSEETYEREKQSCCCV